MTASRQGKSELSRVAFLSELFRLLDQQDVRYCVLHSYESLPAHLHSDLDLAVHPEDMYRLTLVFRALHRKGYQAIQCVNYAVNAFCFVFSWPSGLMLECVAVDCALEYREGGLILFSGASMVADRLRRGAVWIATPGVEFRYILVKKILKGQVSSGAAERLRSLAQALGPARVKSLTADLFGEWATTLYDLCVHGSLNDYVGVLRRRLRFLGYWRRPWDILRFAVAEYRRIVRRWLMPVGLFVVVAGPDADGEETFARCLVSRASLSFRSSRVFHVRPRVLFPDADMSLQGRAALTRAALVCADYWFGYWLVIRALLARSGLIVFSGYFYDLLGDTECNRRRGSSLQARALQAVVPAPDLVLWLASPPAPARRPNGEMRLSGTHCRHDAYPALLSGCNTAVIDTSQNPEQRVAAAAREILGCLVKRFERQHGSWLAVQA